MLLQDQVGKCSPKASKFHGQQKLQWRYCLTRRKTFTEKNYQLSKMKSYWQHSLLARKGYPLHQPHKMEQKPCMQKKDLLHICIGTQKKYIIWKWCWNKLLHWPKFWQVTCHQLFQKLFSPFVWMHQHLLLFSKAPPQVVPNHLVLCTCNDGSICNAIYVVTCFSL